MSSLTVNKTIAGDDAEAERAFRFTITLSDKSVNGEYGSIIFENGVAVVELKGGESVTIDKLPNGVNYTVAEDDYSSDRYETTKSGDSGMIIGNDVAVASFTNTRNKVVTPPPVVHVPDTSDNTGAAGWLSLGLASACGLIGIIVYRKKEEIK